MTHLTPLIGIAAVLATAFGLSRNRKAIKLRIVAWGLSLQFLLALFVMKTLAGYWLIQKVSDGAVWFLSFAFDGTKFVFGPVLGDPHGTQGFVFAFTALPLIIYVAAFFALLYYLRILPLMVLGAGKIMFRLFGTSGAESLEVAASIIMGQTEAPLVIRPFLESLTESELFTIMTAGMAHIAGSVFGAYVLFGADARHLLTAVVMTAPGTLLIAKIMVPETEEPKTAGEVKLAIEKRDVNLLDAISHGVGDGLFLALNVGAMLVAFIALIHLANGLLSVAHTDLQTILGWALAPVAWILGVPWQDAAKVGNLMGIKVVLNEFVAFSQLGPLKGQISERSFTIATYALCGFANFSSIGIQIGGIGALAPSRKQDLARLGFRALLAGTLANYLAAAIAALMLT
jgi:concentrative nucleoside transporter, CNT family